MLNHPIQETNKDLSQIEMTQNNVINEVNLQDDKQYDQLPEASTLIHDERDTAKNLNMNRFSRSMQIEDPIYKREQYMERVRNEKRQEKYNEKRNKYHNTISLDVLTLNVRSIHSEIKKQALFKFFEDNINDCDCIGLTETKLKGRFMWGNKQSFQSRNDEKGGVWFTSLKNQCQKITYFRNSLIWTQVYIKNYPIHIITVYVQPNNSEQTNATINMLDYYISQCILKQQRESKIIVMGDFNQHLRKIRNLMDAYNLTQVFDHNLQTHKDGNQLDQVFTNLKVANKQIIQTDPKLTDHMALKVRLEFEINHKYNKDKQISELTQKQLKKIMQSKQMVNKMRYQNNCFQEKIIDEKNYQKHQSIKKIRWYVPPPTWYMYQGKKHSTNYNMPKEIYWKQLMKKIQEAHYSKQYERYYQLLKKATKIKPTHQILQGIKKGEEISYEENIIQQEITNFFANLYAEKEMKVDDDSDMQNLSSNIIVDDAYIEEAINACNFKKSLGTDGFDGNILKDPIIRKNLKTFVQECIQNGSFPQYLKEGKLILFSKNGSDIASPYETRPIVVMSHITKIVEKTILQILKSENSGLLKVGNYQTGFIDGSSTQLNLTKMLNTICQSRKKSTNRKAYILIDFQKAYDSINRGKLFKILYQKCQTDTEKHIVKCLQDLYTTNFLIYKGQKIEVKKGVFQGSVLSPFLFNIYLDDALNSNQQLKSAIQQKKLLAFADDILIIADTPFFAKKVVKSLEKLEETHHLNLNKGKCQYLTDAKTFQNIQEIEGIKKVQKVKYLGLNISLQKHEIIKDAKDQIKKHLNQIKYKIKIRNPLIQQQLFSMYIKSLLLYHFTSLRASQIICNEDIEKFELFLMRKFMGYANDIKSSTIKNISTQEQFNSSVLIQQRIVHILEKIKDQTQLPSSYYAQKQMEKESKRLKLLKRDKLYVSSELQDLMLAVSARRTVIQFSGRHYCKLHKVIVDNKHINTCSQITCVGDMKKYRKIIDKHKLNNLSKQEQIETILYFISLQNQLKSLEEQNIYQRVTLNPTFKTIFVKKTKKQYQKKGNKEIDAYVQEEDKMLDTNQE